MNKINIKLCNCIQCRKTYKTFNKPGCRDSKREYKSHKNKLRYYIHKTRVKKLRQYKGEDYYNPSICRYTD